VAIWESSIPYIEAEHHAVVSLPCGAPWLDVTPDANGPIGKRLFLPDNGATYGFGNRERALNRTRKRFVDDPLLDELFRLADEYTAFEHAIDVNIGETTRLRKDEADFHRRNHKSRASIQLQLAMKYTLPRAPCFCRSGRRLKSCHRKADGFKT
jgi:hypothetical protein